MVSVRGRQHGGITEPFTADETANFQYRGFPNRHLIKMFKAKQKPPKTNTVYSYRLFHRYRYRYFSDTVSLNRRYLRFSLKDSRNIFNIITAYQKY